MSPLLRGSNQNLSSIMCCGQKLSLLKKSLYSSSTIWKSAAPISSSLSNTNWMKNGRAKLMIWKLLSISIRSLWSLTASVFLSLIPSSITKLSGKQRKFRQVPVIRRGKSSWHLGKLSSLPSKYCRRSDYRWRAAVDWWSRWEYYANKMIFSTSQQLRGFCWLSTKSTPENDLYVFTDIFYKYLHHLAGISKIYPSIFNFLLLLFSLKISIAFLTS